MFIKAIKHSSTLIKPSQSPHLSAIRYLVQRKFVQSTKPRPLYGKTVSNEIDKEDRSIFENNKERAKNHKKEILGINDYSNEVKKPSAKFEDYVLPHPIWEDAELKDIIQTHKSPKKFADYLAYGIVGTLRFNWDLFTGYYLGRKLNLFPFSYRMWLLRIVFLETVAGVPGMMFGMVRHLNSLRRLERDRGWIITLLSEAENERIHLLTAMYLYKPGLLLRTGIVTAQGLMCSFLFPAYLISPRFCHSFVGYLEEQAVCTYTNLLTDIDSGRYPEFNEEASKLAKAYWKLPGIV